MASALGRDGLQCFGLPVSKTCLRAILKYVYCYRRVTTIGIHRVNQHVDLADWLVGEAQRLVEEGARELIWLVDAISGVVAGEDEDWNRKTKRRTKIDSDTVAHLRFVVENAELGASQNLNQTFEILAEAGKYGTGSIQFENQHPSSGHIKTVDTLSPVFDGGISRRFRL